MAVISDNHATLIGKLYLAEHPNVVPSFLTDIITYKAQLGDDPEANTAIIDGLVAERPHALKTPAVDESIDIEAERRAFGPDATPQGRGALYRKYGNEFAERRRQAWGAEPGTIKSGNEPGGVNLDAATVEKARKIVADEFTNSPFNPQKRYLTAETRLADIARYISRYGSKTAQKACDHFQVDLAARPLRKRA
jgi:hypothetical protein